ncbi:MAG: hypothetical protein D6812_02645 [Deltaproteobacteria bacterium]|nr:MAG: hypothetical protein D6812_02645 [Deltaproteobacteria bacterium]
MEMEMETRRTAKRPRKARGKPKGGKKKLHRRGVARRRPVEPSPKQLKQLAVAQLARELGISENRARLVLDGTLSREQAVALEALAAYKKEHDVNSELDRAFLEKQPIKIGIYGHEILEGIIEEMAPYELVFRDIQDRRHEIQKIRIKFFCDAKVDTKSLEKLIKPDEEVRALGLGPIVAPKLRNHIKNKVLFPLMQNREVIFFTTLEGDVIRGIVEGFSRYEIRVRMKGGIPVILLRHAIYDARDKSGKISYLKGKEPSKGEALDGEDSD